MSDATSSTGKPQPVQAKVSWGPSQAVLVTVFAFVGAQIIAGLVLGGVLNKTDDWLNSITGQFIFVVISDILILLSVGLFLRHRHANIRMLGFSRRPALRDVGNAMLAFGVYFLLLLVAVNVLSHITGVNVNQKQELGFDNLYTSPEKLMALASLVILPPIVEETVFRGFLFGGLRRRFSFKWATLMTSLLFAAPHLLATSHGLLWVAGVDTFILSLVLCYLRERTGALWASMLVHALKNSLAFLLLLSSSRFI